MWNPHNLCSCLGSTVLGYITAVLCCGVVIWYTIIANRWLEAARYASDSCKMVWIWLVVIFVFCGSGYGSMVIAFYSPKLAVILRITALAVLNIVCPIFVYYASSRRFMTMGRYESIGNDIANTLSANNEISDRDLASLARNLVSKSLERYDAKC